MKKSKNKEDTKQVKVSKKFHQWLKLTSFKEDKTMQELMREIEKSSMTEKRK